MTKILNVGKRIFIIYLILILTLSAIPFWSAQIVEDKFKSESYENDPVSEAQLSQAVVDYWCELLRFDQEPETTPNGELSSPIREGRTEINMKRASNSKIFVDDDDPDLVTYQIYSGNIHYKNSIGEWEEYDTTVTEYNMVPYGSNFNYEFASEENILKSYFRNRYTKTNSIMVSAGDDNLAWEPFDMALVDSTGSELELSQPANQPPIVQDNMIMYPSSYKNTADLFTVTENRLKHDIILDALPEISDADLINKNLEPSYTYLAYTGVLSPSSDLELYQQGEAKPIVTKVTTEHALTFRSKHGANYFTLPEPIAYELNNKAQQINCQYSIEPVSGLESKQYKLSVQTPYTWLTAQERNYPVVIDPDVTFKILHDEYISNDTFIALGSGGSQVNENYGVEKKLYIGGNDKNDSALIRFDLSSLPANDINFEDAFLYLNTASDISFDTDPEFVTIHEIEEAWVEGTGDLGTPTTDGATWNSPTGATGSWAGGPGGSYNLNEINRTIVTGENLEFEFDISLLLPTWRNNPATNHGLLARYADRESNFRDFKSFHSSKASNSDIKPKLEVIFLNTKPTVIGSNRYKWDEDAKLTIIYLNEHFQDADHHVLNITLWEGDAWGITYDCPVFTANLRNHGNINDPDYRCTIDLKLNKYGNVPITFNATDRISFSEATITIEIKSVNDPPILAPIGNQEAIEEEFLIIPLEVTEVEGQSVVWDTNVTLNYNDPNYMGDSLQIIADPEDPYNQYKKQIRYFPQNIDVPRVFISIFVYDSKHDEDLSPSIDWENITINVTNVNDKPIITKIEYTLVAGKSDYTVTVDQGKKKSLTVQAYDEDIINGDVLTLTSDSTKTADFTITELKGIDIPQDFRGTNRQVYQVDFISSNANVGEYIATLVAEDLDNETDDIKIKYKVNNINDPPIIVTKSMSEPGDKIKNEYTNRDFINFSCEVDDPDLHIPNSNEKLNVTWYSNVTSKRAILGYGTDIKYQLFKAGEYMIEILVKDLGGKEAFDYLNLKVEKSITLQNDVIRDYIDNTTRDDVELSYNHNTKKFIKVQGNYGEIDLIQLGSTYNKDKESLIITLRFYSIVITPVEFDIRVYIVMRNHLEPTPDYNNVEYSSNFYDKELYTPAQGTYYGYFTNEDGIFVDDEFIIEYSLADLEEGVTDRFEPIKADFELFAFVKWKDIEDYGDIENFRYDSIGYISAEALLVNTGGGSSDKKSNDSWVIIASIIIVLIVVFVIIFMVIRKNKAKEKKEVIDFSKSTQGRTQIPQQQIPQMFMSPFEQQFKRPGQQPYGGTGMGLGPGPVSGPGQQMPMQSSPGQQMPMQQFPGTQTPQQQFQRPQLPPQQQRQPMPQSQPQQQPQPSQIQPQTQPQIQPTQQPRQQPQKQPQPQIQQQRPGQIPKP